MYYRNKHEKPKDVSKALLHFIETPDSENRFVESFWNDVTKQLTILQNDKGLKTQNQCSINLEIVTQDLNKSIRQLGIRRKFTHEKIESRINLDQVTSKFESKQIEAKNNTQNQNLYAVDSPSMRLFLNGESFNCADKQKSKENDICFTQLAAETNIPILNNECLTLQRTVSQPLSNQNQQQNQLLSGGSEITKRNYKVVLYQRFKKIVKKMMGDRNLKIDQKIIYSKIDRKMETQQYQYGAAQSPISNVIKQRQARNKSNSTKQLRCPPLVNIEQQVNHQNLQGRISNLSQDTQTSTATLQINNIQASKTDQKSQPKLVKSRSSEHHEEAKTKETDLIHDSSSTVTHQQLNKHDVIRKNLDFTQSAQAQLFQSVLGKQSQINTTNTSPTHSFKRVSFKTTLQEQQIELKEDLERLQLEQKQLILQQKQKLKCSPQRLETIVEPSMEFREETMKHDCNDSSFFQFMSSSDSNSKNNNLNSNTKQQKSGEKLIVNNKSSNSNNSTLGRVIPLPQDTMMIDEDSVFRDITYYHRQQTRESHELFATTLISSSSEVYSDLKDYKKIGKAKKFEQIGPCDDPLSRNMKEEFKIKQSSKPNKQSQQYNKKQTVKQSYK